MINLSNWPLTGLPRPLLPEDWRGGEVTISRFKEKLFQRILFRSRWWDLTKLIFQESLLSSQFEALEEPTTDGEEGLVVVVDCEAEEGEVFNRVLPPCREIGQMNWNCDKEWNNTSPLGLSAGYSATLAIRKGFFLMGEFLFLFTKIWNLYISISSRNRRRYF